MKILKHIFGAALAALGLGCNPVTVPQTPSVDEPSVEPIQKENVVQDFTWKYYQKDDATYRDALTLIKAKNGHHGNIDEYASGRIGSWYFIIFKDDVQDGPLIHDASTTGLEPENTYLLDMQNQKLIAHKEWDSLASLANDLNIFSEVPNADKAKLAQHLALATSIVAFKNPNYLSIITGQKFDNGIANPLLNITPTQATLVYFIIGTGMEQSTTRCELIIDKTGKANFQYAPFESND